MKIYYIFLCFVILLKCLYILSAVRVFIHKRIKKDTNSAKYKKIKSNNEKILVISEFFMFVLLLLIFIPIKNYRLSREPVIVNHHEKLIFFILGILSIINLNYDVFINST